MLKQNLSHYRQALQPLIEQTLLTVPSTIEPSSLWLAAVPAEALLNPAGRQNYALSLTLEELTRNTARTLADSAGHRRPIYFLLALHLTLRAFKAKNQPLPGEAQKLVADLTVSQQGADDPVDLKLWRLLCLADAVAIGASTTQSSEIVSQTLQAITPPGRYGSLHYHDPDESLDAWTYRELIGLHALYGLAQVTGDASLLEHAARVVRHHVENTQPDNTTNQPWALAAFLTLGEDTSFADQQLHDATTQGSSLQSAKAPGLVAGLLLADAWCDLAVS
jgi:hypothetical protein